MKNPTDRPSVIRLIPAPVQTDSSGHPLPVTFMGATPEDDKWYRTPLTDEERAYYEDLRVRIQRSEEARIARLEAEKANGSNK